MTHAPDEIAAMSDDLERVGPAGVFHARRPKQPHPICIKAAAMLRDVDAAGAALAVNVRAMQKTINRQTREAAALRDRFVAAEAERDRLAAMVEKMRGWVRHDDDCGVNALLMPRPPLTKQCTCGLSEVLKESQDESR